MFVGLISQQNPSIIYNTTIFAKYLVLKATAVLSNLSLQAIIEVALVHF